MQNLIIDLVKNFVSLPEEVEVEETVLAENRFLYLLSVNEADIPKVIGKHGRIIKALRDIVRLAAAKKNIFADIEIKNDNRVKP